MNALRWVLGPMLSLALAGVSQAEEGQLRNISTLGFVNEAGMAAGFIIEGDEARTVTVVGEHFNSSIDTRVEVTSIDGSRSFGRNDSWRQTDGAEQLSEIIGREPVSDSDAALVLTLDPGVYVAFLESTNAVFGDGIIAVTVGAGANDLGRFAGRYQGTFTGGDRGSVTVTVASDGQIRGTGTSQFTGQFSVSGTISASGFLQLSTGTTSSGGLFMGRIDNDGQVTGVWSNPSFGSGGTFDGRRL